MQVDLVARGLQELDFSSHESTCASSKERAAILMIEILDASNNEISALRNLKIFASMTTLVLSHNKLAAPLSSWVVELPVSLTTLDLSHNCITTLVSSGSGSSEPSRCGPLVSLQNLTDLDLSNNLLECVAPPRHRHPESAPGLPVLLPPNLLRLDINHNRAIGAVGPLCVGLRALQELRCGYCGIADLAGLEGAALECGDLESVDVAGNPLVSAVGINFAFHIARMFSRLRFVNNQQVRSEAVREGGSVHPRRNRDAAAEGGGAGGKGTARLGHRDAGGSFDQGEREEDEDEVKDDQQWDDLSPAHSRAGFREPQPARVAVTHPRSSSGRKGAERPHVTVKDAHAPSETGLLSSAAGPFAARSTSRSRSGTREEPPFDMQCYSDAHAEDEVEDVEEEEERFADYVEKSARGHGERDFSVPRVGAVDGRGQQESGIDGGATAVPVSPDTTQQQQQALEALLSTAVVLDDEEHSHSKRFAGRIAYLARRAAQLEPILQDVADKNRALREENSELDKKVRERRRLVGAQVREISAIKQEIETLRHDAAQMQAKVRKREHDVTHAKVSASRVASSIARSRGANAPGTSSSLVRRAASSHARSRAVSRCPSASARATSPPANSHRFEDVVRMTRSAVKRSAAIKSRMTRAISPTAASFERFRYSSPSAAVRDDSGEGGNLHTSRSESAIDFKLLQELQQQLSGRQHRNFEDDVDASHHNSIGPHPHSAVRWRSSRSASLSGSDRDESVDRSASKALGLPRCSTTAAHSNSAPRSSSSSGGGTHADPAKVGPNGMLTERHRRYRSDAQDAHLQPPALNRHPVPASSASALSLSTDAEQWARARRGRTNGSTVTERGSDYFNDDQDDAHSDIPGSHAIPEPSPLGAARGGTSDGPLGGPSTVRVSLSMANESHAEGHRRRSHSNQNGEPPLSSHNTSIASSTNADAPQPHYYETKIADVPLNVAVPLLQ